MTNQEIAKILREIAVYLDMQDVPFKPRAYEKAALGVEALEEDVRDIYQKSGISGLENISGVGASIAEKIEEMIKRGKLKYYDSLKKKMPVDISALTSIEGVGPKMVKTLYKKLKIKNITDLERAAKAGKIRRIEHFGQKSEENILKGIEFFKRSAGRFILGFIMPQIKNIEEKLRSLSTVQKIAVAGSVRRGKETIGDIDILVVSKKPKEVMNFFVSMKDVASVYAHGETKSAVKLNSGIDVDLRVVPEDCFGAALNYFTGSKDHNVALRKIAKQKGLKLNEYGLFKGNKAIAGKTEEEIYRELGLKYIEPEMRENWGEIEMSAKNKLPDLINYGDVRGDLQVQTSWTDGSNTIEEMTEAAKKHGLEYIVITDHTKSLAMTGGSDEKKLLKQMEYIDKLNKKIKGIKVLKGAEVNILKDGSLDIKDEVLKKLDVVGASVHSNFNMSKEDMTKRIIRAMENPNVDIIFHPTGRVIQKREAYDLDIEKIIKAAKKTNTALEINAYPERLDLKDEYIKKAVEAGIMLAIDSDAHSVSHFQYLDLGVAQARRGWATRENIINTKPWNEILKSLKH